jgi:penicillin-binding protein 2
MLFFDQIEKNDPSLRLMAVGVLAGMAILLAGLFYLQVFSSHRYVESQKNQSLRSVRIPAMRGKVLDRQGVVLAENRPSYRVVLYLEELRDLFQAEYRRLKGRQKLNRAEAEALGRQVRFQVVSNVVNQAGALLGQPLALSAAEFHRHYNESLLLPMPVLEDLDARQMAVFEEQPLKPRGLNLEMQPLRHYAFGSLACHVLGHVGKARSVSEADAMNFNYPLLTASYEGLVGVEGAFDASLRGRAGGKFVIVNNLGYRQSENIWAPAEPGSNLVLTLDARVQKAAEQALHSLGADTQGSVVVLDCTTGDVLALASAPGYDPNLFVPRLSQVEMEKLYDPEALPILNRASYGSYAPGSIFKIIVALACLEARVLDPNDTFRSPGQFQLGRRIINDEAPPGDYDLRRAFKLSSNTYFIHYGLKAGLRALIQMGEQLHLGQRTEIPLRQDSRGFFPSDSYLQKRKSQGNPWMEGDTANLCIGQGEITVTPLQMAVMTAAIANGGKIFWPRLVQQIHSQNPDAGDAPTTFPAAQLRSQLKVSPRTLEVIRAAMLADVEDSDGTGRRAAVPGFRVCGKTGTAQVKQAGHLVRHDTWFVSFAPYETPRYAVVVLVEGGHYGGTTCAPVARQVYEALHKIDAAPPGTPKVAMTH